MDPRLIRGRSALRALPRPRRFPADDPRTTIQVLRRASDPARAGLIRDVVDAFRCLHGTVRRFAQMFAATPAEPLPAAFGPLLSRLAAQGRAAGFGRLAELLAAIDAARDAEALRDTLFSDVSHDLAALRRAAAELERLDATLVELCVEHVLQRHAAAPAHPAGATA
jgi:hypothetical protein